MGIAANARNWNELREAEQALIERLMAGSKKRDDDLPDANKENKVVAVSKPQAPEEKRKNDDKFYALFATFVKSISAAADDYKNAITNALSPILATDVDSQEYKDQQLILSGDLVPELDDEQRIFKDTAYQAINVVDPEEKVENPPMDDMINVLLTQYSDNLSLLLALANDRQAAVDVLSAGGLKEAGLTFKQKAQQSVRLVVESEDYQQSSSKEALLCAGLSQAFGSSVTNKPAIIAFKAASHQGLHLDLQTMLRQVTVSGGRSKEEEEALQKQLLQGPAMQMPTPGLRKQ